MGKESEQIKQRIGELTERLRQSYDSKIVSEINYWEDKLNRIEQGKPKKDSDV